MNDDKVEFEASATGGKVSVVGPKRLERARQIAEERGEDIQPVHPKNLIPWLENASLEDEEEGQLTELWSRLLLSGGRDFDSELAVLTESLKRIGNKEATLLKDSCFSSGAFPNVYSNHIADDGIEKHNETVCWRR